MPLFRHHPGDDTPGRPPAGPQETVPGLAQVATGQGWTPVAGQPFDGHLEDAVHEITRCLHGAPRSMPTMRQAAIRVDPTTWTDAYRGLISDRQVIIANAWTNITTEMRQAPEHLRGAAVCAVELPGILPVACVQPRRFPAVMAVRETPTGSPVFDAAFLVAGAPVAGGPGPGQVLTPEVQQRIMSRDDWVFRAERYLLGCVGLQPFRTVDEVSQRITDVLGIVAAIPATVLPSRVDHSQDDIVARIRSLTSMDQALAALQALTPAERDQLRQSDSPLSALADVTSPQEAMAAFRSLDPQRKMQVMAMFMRVKDSQRRP